MGRGMTGPGALWSCGWLGARSRRGAPGEEAGGEADARSWRAFYALLRTVHFTLRGLEAIMCLKWGSFEFRAAILKANSVISWQWRLRVEQGEFGERESSAGRVLQRCL